MAFSTSVSAEINSVYIIFVIIMCLSGLEYFMVVYFILTQRISFTSAELWDKSIHVPLVSFSYNIYSFGVFLLWVWLLKQGFAISSALNIIYIVGALSPRINFPFCFVFSLDTEELWKLFDSSAVQLSTRCWGNEDLSDSPRIPTIPRLQVLHLSDTSSSNGYFAPGYQSQQSAWQVSFKNCFNLEVKYHFKEYLLGKLI